MKKSVKKVRYVEEKFRKEIIIMKKSINVRHENLNKSNKNHCGYVIFSTDAIKENKEYLRRRTRLNKYCMQTITTKKNKKRKQTLKTYDYKIQGI
jgi:DNA modification methylase